MITVLATEIVIALATAMVTRIIRMQMILILRITLLTQDFQCRVRARVMLSSEELRKQNEGLSSQKMAQVLRLQDWCGKFALSFISRDRYEWRISYLCGAKRGAGLNLLKPWTRLPGP